MKKIGIITFHRAINYGGVLQAYALYQYLNNIGIDSEIIDYKCEKFEKSYSPIQNTGSFVKNIIRFFTLTPLMHSKNKKFRNFIENNTKLSKECSSNSDLVSIEGEYSSFISGSDQVFTYNWTGFDSAYFLNFVSDEKKKNTYAASFGTNNIPSEYVDKYKEYLHDFRNFSLREESGQKIISEVLNRDSQIHIDPTFLITKEEWGNICEKNKYGDYLLLYTLDKGEHVQEVIDKAKAIAKKENLKILYINDKYFKSNKDIKYLSGISPERFVSLFKNANYIVTNSFHGTTFSIIFNKKFLTTTKMPNGLGTRIENILKLTGLESRNFGISENEKYENSSIDWNIVNKKISKERDRSKEYLLNI